MLDFFDGNVILGKIKTPMPGGILDAARLLAEMDRYGIREAMFYHAFAKRNDPMRGNRLAAAAASCSERLHPCWILLPPGTDETPPLETLTEQMRAARVRAVRIAPDAGNHLFTLAKMVCGELFQWLVRLRLPLLVELGPVPWDAIDGLMETYPGLRLVLVDVNYRANRDLYPRLNAYETLYVETSGLEQHCGIQDVCERFGPERLLFGSRLPLMCPGAARHAVECAGIPEESKRRIAGANLRHLLDEVLL
jgi:predicted TIM-barrel fold metal-dependent hydrolase